MIRTGYTNIERLRSYSSIFSRSVFSDIMKYDDYSRINILYNRYDTNKSCISTYFDYIQYMYRAMSKYYRCEYVYKNEIINKLLINTYGTHNTVAISEFRVKNSIVDFAMFNGESKAFEIKTEYDTMKRLGHQLGDYARLFQKCYVVIPEELCHEYGKHIPENVGVILLARESGKIKLYETKSATENQIVDTDVLLRSVRTSEYKNIVMNYFGELPDVSNFKMFDKCRELIAQIPQPRLQELFLNEVKSRTSNTQMLKFFPVEIRQICLSMNLTLKQTDKLVEKLNNTIMS